MARRSTDIDEDSLLKMGAYLTDKKESSAKIKASKFSMARQFMSMDDDLKAHVEKTKVLEGIGKAYLNNASPLWDESVRVQATTDSIPAIHKSLMAVASISLGMSEKNRTLASLMPEVRAMSKNAALAHQMEQDASGLLNKPFLTINTMEEYTKTINGKEVTLFRPKMDEESKLPTSQAGPQRPLSSQRSYNWAMENITNNSDAASAVAHSMTNETERVELMKSHGWWWDAASQSLRGKRESMSLIANEKSRILGAAKAHFENAAMEESVKNTWPNNPDAQAAAMLGFGVKNVGVVASAFAELSKFTYGDGKHFGATFLNDAYALQEKNKFLVEEKLLTPRESEASFMSFLESRGADQAKAWKSKAKKAREEEIATSINRDGLSAVNEAYLDIMLANDGDSGSTDQLLDKLVDRNPNFTSSTGYEQANFRESLESQVENERKLTSMSMIVEAQKKQFEDWDIPLDSYNVWMIPGVLLNEAIESWENGTRPSNVKPGVKLSDLKVRRDQWVATGEQYISTDSALIPGQMVPQSLMDEVDHAFKVTGTLTSEEYKDTMGSYKAWNRRLKKMEPGGSQPMGMMGNIGAKSLDAKKPKIEQIGDSMAKAYALSFSLNFMDPEDRAQATKGIESIVVDSMGFIPGEVTGMNKLVDDYRDSVGNIADLLSEQRIHTGITGFEHLTLREGGARKISRRFSSARNLVDGVEQTFDVGGRNIGELRLTRDEAIAKLPHLMKESQRSDTEDTKAEKEEYNRRLQAVNLAFKARDTDEVGAADMSEIFANSKDILASLQDGLGQDRRIAKEISDMRRFIADPSTSDEDRESFEAHIQMLERK